jgi:hypothetical protein
VQSCEGFSLLLLESLIDRITSRRVILALKHRRQGALEFIDQLCILSWNFRARPAGSSMAFGVRKIVHVDPVRRARPWLGILDQDGLNGLLHAGAAGADHEKIETLLAGMRSKSNGIAGPCLPDKAIDRLQLSRGRKRSLQMFFESKTLIFH